MEHNADCSPNIVSLNFFSDHQNKARKTAECFGSQKWEPMMTNGVPWRQEERSLPAAFTLAHTHINTDFAVQATKSVIQLINQVFLKEKLYNNAAVYPFFIFWSAVAAVNWSLAQLIII